MLDAVKSAEILKRIGEKFHEARMNYMGTEGKQRSWGKPGISFRDLAAVARVKPNQISDIEKGRANATILTMISIADVLDVDLCELLAYKSSRKKDK